MIQKANGATESIAEAVLSDQAVRVGCEVYSPTEHLARSLWLSRFEWSNRMAMYSAYFDESGHPDDSPYLVVAGCVADVMQWTHFEREWLTALAPLGTAVFHAAEFRQGKPPFDTLSSAQADELLNCLVGIICRRVEKSFAVCVELKDYWASNAKYVLDACYGFPYPFLARVCLAQTCDWGDYHKVPQNEIKFFFEDGAKHKGQIEWLEIRDNLPKIYFEAKSAAPVQAADLIAWCLNLYLTNPGYLRGRYEKALDRLQAASCHWEEVNFKDPDRVPTLLGIPLRNPDKTYKSVIVKKDGKKLALTRYWDKGKKVAKLKRGTLVLPERPAITREYLVEAIRRYEASKAASVE